MRKNVKSRQTREQIMRKNVKDGPKTYLPYYVKFVKQDTT